MQTLQVLALAATILALPGAASAGTDIRVVTSIKPVHSLVSGVMQGVGTPHLIVKGGASPHSYALKPSDAAALQQADLVFWIGPDLELFLEKSVQTLASNARVVELQNAAGILRLGTRDGNAIAGAEAPEGMAKSDGDHDPAEDDHGATDMHFWLDPVNARTMVGEIEKSLSAADPANAAAYRSNAAALGQRIDSLGREIAVQLAPFSGRPFIVFHDAYQYFERRFGLSSAGSMTANPEITPGARRVSAIRDRIKTLGATCVFAEPQFEPALVNTIIEGTDAISAVLDPVGADLTDGPELYFNLMRNMAGSIRDCLSRGG